MKNILFKSTILVACFCIATLSNAQTVFDVDGKLHINSAGNVGIGTVTPTFNFTVQATPVNGLNIIGADGSFPKTVFESHTPTNWQGSYFQAFRSKGTLASPAGTVWGDNVFNFDLYGHNGTGYKRGAQFSFTQVGNAGTGVPIFFKVACWNSSDVVEWNVISAGYSGVGLGVPQAKNRLDVEGSAVIGATYSGTNTAPINGLLVEGNVGIGSTAPGGQLELGLDEGRKPATNTWTIPSDERLKNITGTYDKGLDEIMKLEPITYHYKNVEKRKLDEQVLSTENVGFSAQEVQKVFPEAVDIDDDGYLNFNMHAILVAQVNAIKEQEEKIVALAEEVAKVKYYDDAIKNLQELVAQLQNENQTLSKQLGQFSKDLQQCCLAHQNKSTTGSTNRFDDKAHLAQNIPNPFNRVSIIKYYLPKNTGQAQIRISDLGGNLIKVAEVHVEGYGQVEITANSLAPGTYVYELVVGNERIDTKRMIILR